MRRLKPQLLYPVILCWTLQASAIALATGPGPAEMLQDVTNVLLAEIRKDPDQLRDVRRVRALTDRYILPHIDFQAAAQWVLGKYWRSASDTQRARFVGEFRQLLLNTYVRSISDYRENKVTIGPARGTLASGRAEVDAEIERPGGPPVRLGFRMHRPGEDWLVYDISVEGVSLVATHRSSFAREIHDKGLDSLLEHIASMNGSGQTGNITGDAGGATAP
ncbi:MAG: ABC transporter substrate-binding protein [Pseudomonadota bacterium]